MPWLEIGIIVGLILLNGFFAMSELAVVSARRTRLLTMANEGSRGAREALKLASEPGRFLSSVQIGITLIGIGAGAYGGATLSEPLATVLTELGLPGQRAGTVAFGVVVIGITYLSVIIGELVPKQLALVHAETIARWVALPMVGVAKFTSPAVWLLEHSSNLVLRLLRAERVPRQVVTEEEVKTVIAEAAEAGVVLAQERDMLARVMTFADLRVQAIMTPRTEMATIDTEASRDELLALVSSSTFSHFPVAQGDSDNVVGTVSARDLLAQLLSEQPLDIRAAVQKPLVVFEGISAVAALEQLRHNGAPLALVVDEYGHVLGMVTSADILAALTGGLNGHDDHDDPDAVQRPDGSWLFDGALPLEEVWSCLELQRLPERGDYHTLAGLVLSVLGTIPTSGDSFEWHGLNFEVVDMDGRRIDKVLVTPLEVPAEPGEE
ncbi:MAG: hemolysin family protein [Spongiibacteraceae bacterium]|jgi:putative hemolysin|nr:hemolysin family protein [Spongiibacteraceae bacterium]